MAIITNWQTRDPATRDDLRRLARAIEQGSDRFRVLLIKSTDQLVTGGSLTEVQELTIAIPAAGRYRFDFNLICANTNTTSSNVVISPHFSGAVQRIGFTGGVMIQGAIWIPAASVTNGGQLLGTSSNTTQERVQRASGVLDCTSGGNLSVRVSRSPGDVRVLAGSSAFAESG